MTKIAPLFSILLVLLALGCQKKTNSSDTGTVQGTQSKSKIFTDSYNLTVNGCSTGEQSFTANSQRDLSEKFCKGLQDEVRNKGCALEARRSLFEARCSGVKWRQGSHSVLPDSENPSRLITEQDLIDAQSSGFLDEFLLHLEVSTSETVNLMDQHSMAWAKEFIEVVGIDGLNSTGPLSQGYRMVPGAEIQSLSIYNGYLVQYSEFLKEGHAEHFGIVFIFDRIYPFPSITNVYIVSLKKHKGVDSLITHLADTSRYERLVKFSGIRIME